MGIIVTAVLVASICLPNEDCKVSQVASFYNDNGPDFCYGTADGINSVGDEVGVSTYFCVSPERAKELFPNN